MKSHSKIRGLFTTTLALLLLTGAAQCRKVREPEPANPQTQTAKREGPDLKIGLREFFHRLADAAWGPSAVYDFNGYEYYRDEKQVGIRVPVNNISNLYMYAFKSYEQPDRLRVYLAQLYEQEGSSDSLFSGGVGWLNLQDYNVNYARYQNGQVTSVSTINHLTFLEDQYKSFHGGTPSTPDVWGIMVASTPTEEQSCEQMGGFVIDENGETGCLFGDVPFPDGDPDAGSGNGGQTGNTGNGGTGSSGPGGSGGTGTGGTGTGGTGGTGTGGTGTGQTGFPHGNAAYDPYTGRPVSTSDNVPPKGRGWNLPPVGIIEVLEDDRVGDAPMPTPGNSSYEVTTGDLRWVGQQRG